MKFRRLLLCLAVSLLAGCMSSRDPLTSPDLRLSFAIDKQYDIDHVLGMFLSYTPAGLESRAKSMGVDINIAREIREADLPEAKELAAKLVEDRFAKNGAAIQASEADFEAQWQDLLPFFAHVVADTTESPWVHPE